jgi:glutathione S-transferase
VVTRVLHFGAYVTAQLHDVRAAMWTPGSLAIICMAIYTLTQVM